MFGYEPGTLVGTEVNQLVPVAIRDEHAEHRRAYHENPETRSMGSGLALFATRRDGSTFPVEIALSPLDVDGVTHVVAIVRDRTDHQEAEQRARDAEQALALLEDRERIARDLHDTVIQRLFAAGMSLQAAAAHADEEVAARVNRVVDELDATIRDVRQTIFKLTAHNLAASSLRRRIVTIVDEQEAALGFAPDVRFSGAIDSIDDLRAEHLLAVLREALTNVARHAGASRVEIVVTAVEQVSISVADDGVGMPADPVPGGGTVNLRDRADALAGSLTVEACEPRGTKVTWSVPAA